MMTAEQLKSSILQLAMQGKLVEQRPEEGTGEELFKKILAEKKKLIKEGKVKKQKDLSPITEDSAPFEIPESWKWANLGEIIDYRMGKTPPRAEAVYWENDIFWVSIADMVDGKIITETKEKISHKALVERFNDQISPKGTLIMSFKLTVGRVSILGMDAVHNEAIISIFPFINTDDVLRDYLKTMLPFLSVYGESKKAIKGFTLNSASLNQIPVPLPPLAEQRRIVAKIEELMPFVEQYAAVSTKLNKLNAAFPEIMKKSILQEAVQGKLVPQDPNDEPASLLLKKIAEEKKRLIKEGKIKKQKPLPEITEDEIPFDIPESWEWARLGDLIFEAKDGPHFSPKYQDQGVPFISTRNISGGKLDFSGAKFISEKDHIEFSKKVSPKKGDILYSKGGTTGIAAVNDTDIVFDVWVHVAVLSLGKHVNPYYLATALNSPHCYNLSQKYTHGTGNHDLGLTRMIKITIPLPPIKEQQRIVDRLDEILPIAEELAQ